MELNVTFRHTDSSDAIKEHISDSIKKLTKYLLKPEGAHAIVMVEKFRQIAEITLVDNGDKITAIDESEDMYQSIDAVVAKLEKQLKKHKDKVKSHRLA
jgi:putative sigma-54 modulation protein